MKHQTPRDDKPLVANSCLDDLLPTYAEAAARVSEDLRRRPYWTDDAYVDCRGCGFPLAIRQYHIQTMSLVEECHRCGFSCSYSLESRVPSVLAEYDSSQEMADFLASESAGRTKCAGCGEAALIFLDVRRSGYMLISYCLRCMHHERSTERTLPIRPADR